MKKLTFILILLMGFGSIARSEEKKAFKMDSIPRTRLVLYINQPLGWIGKNRIRIGFQDKKRDSYLLTILLHRYHSAIPLWEESYNTGTQVTFTYQKHIVDELFLYASAGYGEFVSETRNLSLLGSSIRLNQSNGNYLVIGAGMSQELNLNKSGRFTVQFIEGLKYAHLIYENGPFESKTFRFVFSPGSLLDMNINFGLKF